MKTLNKKEILSRMKLLTWDYDVDPWKLYEVITGKIDKAGPFTREMVFLRMMERLSWYDCIHLLGIEFLRKELEPSLIKKIRFKALREKYEFARKVLQGKTVPSSGWSAENRERIKHSLLSDRWYRAEQALL
jgi:hypothetical protein